MAKRRPVLLWIPTVLAVLLGGAFLASYRADLPLAALNAKYASADSRFANVLGNRLHYRIHGNGPDVLLLHDANGSLHAWDSWIDVLERDLRVIRLDLPGFGLTGPEAAGDYSVQHYVRIVDEFARQLGLEQFHLIGHGLGGEIAWNYALQPRAPIQRVVLISPSGYPRQTTGPPLVLRIARVPGAAWLATTLTPRSQMSALLARSVANPESLREDVIDRYYELSLRAGNRRAAMARAIASWEDPRGGHERMTQPTLLLWGMEDRQMPLSEARGFVDDIPNARLITYPGVGHLLPEEHPRPAARAALVFLRDPLHGRSP